MPKLNFRIFLYVHWRVKKIRIGAFEIGVVKNFRPFIA